ncbi:protein-tyrosine phosphatase [Hephaestia caeni]|uniref:protein-tyrosine-phosphatase n=1 Tax=Hephaestia caeni TaxID=645617 RepID=A0A397PMY2_9SPHN|nr:low molecular weight protein-tyrosine-phosphatase [Hephaestia caeni]RIA47091.1 protein-tyrosine phosphatase [Hephaestia caeni]
MPQSPSILFVCLGNICRSPLAEGAFRAAAQAAGLDVAADSAGTGDWHVGRPPDTRAQAVARAHGVDISGLRARQVTAEDFHRFTHVFALDPANLADLAAIRPADATADLGLLMDVVPGRKGSAVDDPYYGDAAGFEATWADVTAAAARLVDRFGG